MLKCAELFFFLFLLFVCYYIDNQYIEYLYMKGGRIMSGTEINKSLLSGSNSLFASPAPVREGNVRLRDDRSAGGAIHECV